MNSPARHTWRAGRVYLLVSVSAPEVQRSVERVSHDHGAIRAHLAAVEAQSVATHLADTHLVGKRRHETSAGRTALGFWFTEHPHPSSYTYIYTPHRWGVYNLVCWGKHLGFCLKFTRFNRTDVMWGSLAIFFSPSFQEFISSFHHGGRREEKKAN